MKMITLIDKPDIAVNYFQANSEAQSSICVITFTERTNRNLSGKGFGGDLILKNDMDLICVKTNLDC